jgi:hypothetical protein
MDEEQEQRWVELYRTALLELDCTMLPERIRYAHDAIQKRLAKLATNGTGKSALAEQRALEDALRNLRILAKTET